MPNLKDTIQNLLNECDDVSDFMYEENVLDDDLKLLNIKARVEDHHGGMDKGSDYWTVWSFEDMNDKVYVKFQGYYASHYGSEYEEFYFVQPKEKVITVYEK